MRAAGPTSRAGEDGVAVDGAAAGERVAWAATSDAVREKGLLPGEVAALDGRALGADEELPAVAEAVLRRLQGAAGDARPEVGSVVLALGASAVVDEGAAELGDTLRCCSRCR